MNDTIGKLIGLGVMLLLIIVIIVWAKKDIQKHNGYRKGFNKR